MTEAEISKQVKKRLDYYQYFGEILWYTLLQSLKIQHHGHWIQGCKPGTPDYIAIVRNKQLTLSVIFIEVKSEKGQLRPEQKAFAQLYKDVKNVHVFTVRDSEQINEIIETISVRIPYKGAPGANSPFFPND